MTCFMKQLFHDFLLFSWFLVILTFYFRGQLPLSLTFHVPFFQNASNFVSVNLLKSELEIVLFFKWKHFNSIAMIKILW